MTDVTAIILAAGKSSRFGKDKLTAKLTDNHTVLSFAVKPLIEVVPSIIAVIAPEQTEREDQLQALGIETKVCPQADQGIGVSLAWGVKNSTADAWLIALADMPYINIDTVWKVYRQLQSGQQLVAPYYRQRRGHPVGFGSRFKKELLNLDSDIGARSIFQRYRTEQLAIQVNDPGILSDVDTPADLQYFVR